MKKGVADLAAEAEKQLEEGKRVPWSNPNRLASPQTLQIGSQMWSQMWRWQQEEERQEQRQQRQR